mmetsp:Transcript_126204/g.403936  ORF Transcript_126204/g.403936 Transcript_126204/m.403936 type:complete len:397 (-) Transcript_126204:7-1197(-)
MPLVVVRILLQFHAHQIPTPLAALSRQALLGLVHARELRLHGLLRVEGRLVCVPDQVVLRQDGVRLHPPRVGRIVPSPEPDRQERHRRPQQHDADVAMHQGRRQHEHEGRDVDPHGANEQIREVALRKFWPAEDELEELALVEQQHEVQLLLPRGQRDRRVPCHIRHVEHLHCANVQQHLDDLHPALLRRPMHGGHAVVVAVHDAGGPRQEPLHSPRVAPVARPVERRPTQVVLLAARSHPIAIARRQQHVVAARDHLQRGQIRGLGSQVHGRLPDGIGQVRARASLEEPRHQGVELEPSSPMQGRVSLGVLAIHIETTAQQVAHRRHVLREGRLHHGCIGVPSLALGGRRGGRQLHVNVGARLQEGRHGECSHVLAGASRRDGGAIERARGRGPP